MLPLLLLLASADPLSAADIMSRVVENQTRAEAARQQWVYSQEVFVRSQQRNKKVMHEQTRQYRVAPGAKDHSHSLESVRGQYRKHGRMQAYAGSKPHEDVPDDFVNDFGEGLFAHEKSKDGISPGMFPLAGDKLKGYTFTRKSDAQYQGHAVYVIDYMPIKNGKYDYVGDPWEGEVLVEKETFQPLFISSFLSFKMPLAIKIMLGLNIRDFGVKVEYAKFADGVYFPVKGGGEFRFDAVWFFKRDFSFSFRCDNFQRAAAESTVNFETPLATIPQ